MSKYELKYFFVVVMRVVYTHDDEAQIFQRHAVRAGNVDEAVGKVKEYMDSFWVDTRKSRSRDTNYPRLAKYYSPGELDMAGEYAQVSEITEKTLGGILTAIMLP